MRHPDRPLFLVRHGETEWNASGRYQGHLNSPLTERGKAQAEASAQALSSAVKSEREPLRTYVSPLGRAQETAAIIARTVSLETRTEPRIAEVSAGSWDGMSLYEIEMEYPDALAGTNPFDWYFRSPDGESFESAIERVSSWLREADRPALAVTHGLASRLIRGVYLSLSRADMLSLDVSQGVVHCLEAGQCSELGSR